MVHYNTVINQMLQIVYRHQFDSLAEQHHSGQNLRSFSRWSQFVAMAYAQLSARKSLRDITDNLDAQSHKLYHLGAKKVSRSTLARVNEKQPYQLYEALFGSLLARCHDHAPKHKFKFKNKLYSLDASTIGLCLELFPWAECRHKKGGIKLHAGLDHDGYLPAFIGVTTAREHEIDWGRKLKLPKGSIVVFDRGYADHDWFDELSENGISFVTRLKKNTRCKVVERCPANKKQGILSDETVLLTLKGKNKIPRACRRIRYEDAGTGKAYAFLTNNFKLAPKTIADIYKSRWQIELFFKWIKQNLKIKTFFGTSKNAVLTQIWIAICIYLLLAYIKFKNGITLSMQQILRLLSTNLFERRSFVNLLKPPEILPCQPSNQLVLL